MKWLLGVTVIGAVVILVRKLDGTAIINRAMVNCYRDGVRDPNWYKR